MILLGVISTEYSSSLRYMYSDLSFVGRGFSPLCIRVMNTYKLDLL